MEFRINGFDQIKAFYSIVFEGKYEIKTQHISLYVFLINQNNRNNWIEWFKCPFDLAMAGACIGSKSTYYKCLYDLQEWGFIQYEKGINDFKAPKIKIEVLNCTSTVPQSEPLLEQLPIPQGIPLLEQLPIHIYKLITDNIKLITNKENEFEKLISDFFFKSEIFSFRKALTDFGVDRTIIDEWMKVRKLKKLTNSETAFKAIQKQIYKSGLTPTECIKKAVEKSWGGFEADWLKQTNNINGNNRRDLSQIDHGTAKTLADI